MKESKNLERLFQEKFKDFESTPPSHVWENIAIKLQKKKKKRIIPIWFRYGIAASIALIVGFGIYNSQNNNPTTINQEKNQIVTEENNELKKNKNKSSINHQKNQDLNFEGKNSNLLDSELKKNKTVEHSKKSSESLKNQFESKKSKKIKERKEVALGVAIENDKKHLQNKNIDLIENPDSEGNFIANNNKKVEKIDFSDKNNFNELNNQNQLKDKIASNLKDNNQNDKVLKEQSIIKEDLFLNKKNDAQNILKPSKIDSLENGIIAENKSNELELLFIEKSNKTEEIIVTDKINKWEISSNVAPVYFNSLADGSTIDSEFSNNNKSYETNLSLGLGVKYAINKRISIRTGVNRFSLGYNTNDVSFGANMQGKTLENVNHSPIGATISVSRINSPKNSIDETFSTENSGFLNQRIGYFEVPFEVSYQLLNNKMGISIIGGMSSLFLVENQISVVSTEFTTPIGEANNLNPLSFSTNIGLGFDYPFWKSFHVHIEPVLKYQFNTFNSNVNGFRPFFMGLYSGISYRF